MKRLLSVILSLALLASALIIPMSVSAVGEDTAAAAEAVVNAVNKLEFDTTNTKLFNEIASPAGSQTGENDTFVQVNNNDSMKWVDSDTLAEHPLLGTKAVKVTGNKVCTSNDNNWKWTDTLNAIRYTYSGATQSNILHLSEIGYLVVYVKTNKKLEFSLGMFTGWSIAPQAIKATVEPTNGKYVPVVLDMTSVNWKNNNLYSYHNQINSLFVRITSVGDDAAHTITADDGIVFGSIQSVPVESAVRDFKFDYTIGNYRYSKTKHIISDKNWGGALLAHTVTLKYHKDNTAIDYNNADTVADIIASAETICNDGRYTTASFQALTDAITAAKQAVANSGDNNQIVALFKAEVEKLYTEEVIAVPASSKEGLTTKNNANLEGLTEYQQSSLGDFYTEVDSNITQIYYINANSLAASKKDPTYSADYAIKLDGYDEITVPVYNKSGARVDSMFDFGICNENVAIRLISFFNASRTSRETFKAYSGFNELNLSNSIVFRTYSEAKTVSESNATTTATNKEVRYRGINDFYLYDSTFAKGNASQEYQYPAERLGPTSLRFSTGGKDLIFGSMIGKKYFKADDTFNAIENKRSAVAYYINNIKTAGYENLAMVTETANLLGLTEVEIVKELDDTIEVTATEGNFSNAVAGENITFTLSNIQKNVKVTVRYDGAVIEPNANNKYTITVKKGEKLYIIPSHKVTEAEYKQIDWSETDNVSLNITPHMYTSNYSNNKRTEVSSANLKTYSNGVLQKKSTDSTTNNDVSIGFQFRDSSGNYLNNYKPGEAFDFEKESYDAYVDIIYDLGRPADVYKFQHISGGDYALAMGVYQIYASTSAVDLFTAENLVLNYQCLDLNQYGNGNRSQEHVFAPRTAQFVAIRCYMPIIDPDIGKDTPQTAGYLSNVIRVAEFAFYGKESNTVDYKITEIAAPTSTESNPTSVAAGDLLNAKTFESVQIYNNGTTTTKRYADNSSAFDKLNGQTYWSGGHSDLGFGNFCNGTNFKNGYKLDRKLDGNIDFVDSNAELEMYYDFTYDLGSYSTIDRIETYLCNNLHQRVQAYEVYISTDRDNLYTDASKVFDYNNYYNTYGQKIVFDQSKLGKYIGFRVLNPGYYLGGNNNGSYTYPRIDELAAYSNSVEDSADIAPKADSLSSRKVFIWDSDGSSIYNLQDDTKCTAARLTLKYCSPVNEETGSADTTKIVLANGKYANIVERNVIAISKKKYKANSLTTLDISTAGAFVSTATGENLKRCWDDEVNGDYADVYAAYKLNNIKSNQKDLEFVVTGRIVYEYEGKYYTAYSPVVGATEAENEGLDAQWAYEALKKPSNKWFTPETTTQVE